MSTSGLAGSPQVRGGDPGLALSVHGPAGALDLLVPAEASVGDVARAYAAQAGLGAVPALRTAIGAPLDPAAPLDRAGVEPGAVLVVGGPETGGGAPVPAEAVRVFAGPVSAGSAATWAAVGVGLAAAGGAMAVLSGSAGARRGVVAALVVAVLACLLPLGRQPDARRAAAPALAAVAALVATWEAVPERRPLLVGTAALAAAAVAALARALDRRTEEALRVWLVAGVSVFVVTAVCGLLGIGAPTAWSLLLVGALLAARVVPGLAVDVPDQLLVDLERLAVTAWSARDVPRGRRGRTVVPPRAVEAVAARGTRLVHASSVAVLGVTAVAAPMLLATTTLPLDRVGARCLVAVAGAGLLLAARSYRHRGSRTALRLAGLVCWAALGTALLGRSGGADTAVALVAIGVALVLVLVAVATGRGWRSAWWSRQAEVAETLSGAVAVASVLVTSGVFRSLWELSSTRFNR